MSTGFCWLLLVVPFVCSLASASAVPLQSRQASNTCKLPKYKPLIDRLAKEYPRPAVNAFCSAVIGKDGLPKTTVTAYSYTTITDTYIDTVTSTNTICVTRLAKRAPAPATATPTPSAAPAAALTRDKNGGALGFGPNILTKACQCVLPTSTTTVTVPATRVEYDFRETTVVPSTTITVTEPLPTFRARGKEQKGAIHRNYLQSSQILDEKGVPFTNGMVNVSSKALATIFSLTCEGYLLQTNTSALGEDRLLADVSFAVAQQPIYFDPDRRVDAAGQNDKPLICRIEADELKCFAVVPELNQFQYCPSYPKFFGTGILLAPDQGPECLLFTVAVEPI